MQIFDYLSIIYKHVVYTVTFIVTILPAVYQNFVYFDHDYIRFAHFNQEPNTTHKHDNVIVSFHILKDFWFA